MNELPVYLIITASKSYQEKGCKQATVRCSWARLLESHSSTQVLHKECVSATLPGNHTGFHISES